MKLGWATDIHLDSAHRERREAFYNRIKAEGLNALVLTGDNSSAPHLHSHLLELAVRTAVPLYFVNGNHDYYGGSIGETRNECTSRYGELGKSIVYLPTQDYVALSPSTVLIGQDGWYDGRNGDFENSPVELNDFVIIEELSRKSKDKRLEIMQLLADNDAREVHRKCSVAAQIPGLKKIIVATHVPPFRQSAWHEGQPSNRDFLPYFSNRSFGESVLESTEEFRQGGGEVTILCGHVHSSGVYYVSPGLECLTGAAKYGKPSIQQSFKIS